MKTHVRLEMTKKKDACATGTETTTTNYFYMFKDLQILEQVIDAQEFTSAVITITPDMAELMLARNTGNRTISEAQVILYSSAMVKGLWRLIGESIEFDSTGRLLNGQHILMAVVKSGISIRSLVSGGITPDAFPIYDCRRSRTLSHYYLCKGRKTVATHHLL